MSALCCEAQGRVGRGSQAESADAWTEAQSQTDRGRRSVGPVPYRAVLVTPQAKAEWKRAAPQLHARRLLTPDTLATLESYCIAIGLVRECENIMSREGRMVEGEDGAKPHAAFKMQGAAMREASHSWRAPPSIRTNQFSEATPP